MSDYDFNQYQVGYKDGYSAGFMIGAVTSFFGTMALCLLVGAFIK